MNRAYALMVCLAALALAACGAASAPGAPGAALPGGAAAATPAPASAPQATQAPAARPAWAGPEWRTDFAKHRVPLNELTPGGPPRDGIPPIDNPKFETVRQADTWLEDREPVVLFEQGDDVRAYPLQILIWHEIVNDLVGGVPVMVTFCPLCNTAIAFDRRLGDTTYTFGTSGLLRNSDLVMWDRQTESLWQQITGEAIVGELTGKQLAFLPTSIVAWVEYKSAFPGGTVLSRDTGFERPYGQNPYVGYDAVGQIPFLFNGQLDQRLPAMERVVTISAGGEDVAYPFSVLQEQRVVNDTVGGMSVVVFFHPGTASALDGAAIAQGRDVGSGTAFSPILDGQRLTFVFRAGQIVDEQTGSAWDITGGAISGGHVGKRLAPIVHGNHFWFAWVAFKPGTRIYRPA
jgi:hypothetical protein